MSSGGDSGGDQRGAKADPALLGDIYKQKQQELSQLDDYRLELLESQNRKLQEEVAEASFKYKSLKEDFQHNLNLLTSRDEAIARQQMLFEEVKSVLKHKDASLSDAKIALDTAQAEKERVRKHMEAQLTALQQQNETLARQNDSLHVEYRSQLEEHAQEHDRAVSALSQRVHHTELRHTEDNTSLILKHESEMQKRTQALRAAQTELKQLELTREREQQAHAALVSSLQQSKDSLERELSESRARVGELEESVAVYESEKHTTALNMSNLEMEIEEFGKVKSELVEEYQRKFQYLDDSRVQLEQQKDEEVVSLKAHFDEVQQRLQARYHTKEQDLSARVASLQERLQTQVREGAAIKLELQKELEHKESLLRETEARLRELPLEKERELRETKEMLFARDRDVAVLGQKSAGAHAKVVRLMKELAEAQQSQRELKERYLEQSRQLREMTFAMDSDQTQIETEVKESNWKTEKLSELEANQRKLLRENAQLVAELEEMKAQASLQNVRQQYLADQRRRAQDRQQRVRAAAAAPEDQAKSAFEEAHSAQLQRVTEPSIARYGAPSDLHEERGRAQERRHAEERPAQEQEQPDFDFSRTLGSMHDSNYKHDSYSGRVGVGGTAAPHLSAIGHETTLLSAVYEEDEGSGADLPVPGTQKTQQPPQDSIPVQPESIVTVSTAPTPSYAEAHAPNSASSSFPPQTQAPAALAVPSSSTPPIEAPELHAVPNHTVAAAPEPPKHVASDAPAQLEAYLPASSSSALQSRQGQTLDNKESPVVEGIRASADRPLRQGGREAYSYSPANSIMEPLVMPPTPSASELGVSPATRRQEASKPPLPTIVGSSSAVSHDHTSVDSGRSGASSAHSSRQSSRPSSPPRPRSSRAASVNQSMTSESSLASDASSYAVLKKDYEYWKRKALELEQSNFTLDDQNKKIQGVIRDMRKEMEAIQQASEHKLQSSSSIEVIQHLESRVNYLKQHNMLLTQQLEELQRSFGTAVPNHDELVFLREYVQELNEELAKNKLKLVYATAKLKKGDTEFSSGLDIDYVMTQDEQDRMEKLKQEHREALAAQAGQFMAELAELNSAITDGRVATQEMKQSYEKQLLLAQQKTNELHHNLKRATKQLTRLVSERDGLMDLSNMLKADLNAAMERVAPLPVNTGLAGGVAQVRAASPGALQEQQQAIQKQLQLLKSQMHTDARMHRGQENVAPTSRPRDDGPSDAETVTVRVKKVHSSKPIHDECPVHDTVSSHDTSLSDTSLDSSSTVSFLPDTTDESPDLSGLMRVSSGISEHTGHAPSQMLPPYRTYKPTKNVPVSKPSARAKSSRGAPGRSKRGNVKAGKVLTKADKEKLVRNKIRNYNLKESEDLGDSSTVSADQISGPLNYSD